MEAISFPGASIQASIPEKYFDSVKSMLN